MGGGTEAHFVRAFTPPDNLLPRTADGVHHDVGGSVPPGTTPPVLLTGRQEGRGYEGLAVSPDGRSYTRFCNRPCKKKGR